MLDVNDLIAERERLQTMLAAVDGLIAAMGGEVKVPPPAKVLKKKQMTHADGTPNRHGSAAGNKYAKAPKPCCGSVGSRHKKDCSGEESGGAAPTAVAKATDWRCIDCSETFLAREKPEHCPTSGCNSRMFVQA